MRLDDFLSTVGLIKRRTIAKDMAQSGLILVNGNKAKPAHPIKINDIIQVKGSHPLTAEVVEIPAGSVAKEQREKYFKLLA